MRGVADCGEVDGQAQEGCEVEGRVDGGAGLLGTREGEADLQEEGVQSRSGRVSRLVPRARVLVGMRVQVM